MMRLIFFYNRWDSDRGRSEYLLRMKNDVKNNYLSILEVKKVQISSGVPSLVS